MIPSIKHLALTATEGF